MIPVENVSKNRQSRNGKHALFRFAMLLICLMFRIALQCFKPQNSAFLASNRRLPAFKRNGIQLRIVTTIT